MPLSDKQREEIEDTIVDLHFTSEKFIETGKEVHKKLLEVNVQEAIELLEKVKEEIQDDQKAREYMIHFLLPFQLYHLIQIREGNQND